jgi:succinyl-CoA synthetase beta subunit
MVNGAGLAMATMDIIAAYGAKPANFLDVSAMGEMGHFIWAVVLFSRGLFVTVWGSEPILKRSLRERD